MFERMLYNIDGERFWFPVEDGTTGVFENHLRLGSYPNVYFQTIKREPAFTGLVIPVHFVQDLDLPVASTPEQIRESTTKLIPCYGKLVSFVYGGSYSPIGAVEKSTGGCLQRTSIAAAIAALNGLPYRIVGSEDIAPKRSFHDLLITLLYYYRNFMTRSLRSEYMFRRPYPHWWLEIYDSQRWVTVDSVEWNPVSFRPFRKSINDKKIVCLEQKISF